MPLSMTQLFLPLVTADRRVLGIAPISAFTFDGTEAFYPTGVRSAFLTGGTVGAMTLSTLQALSGVLTVTLDGVVSTSANIVLSAATSFANAASIIQAAFSVHIPVVTFDATAKTFILTSPTKGASSSITAATGTLSAGLFLYSGTGSVVTSYSAPPAGAVPLKLYSPRAKLWLAPQDQPTVNYMGVPITPTQERQSNYGPSWLQPFIPYTKWRQSPGFARYDWKGNALQEMLQGQSVDAIVVPTPATPTASNGALDITWSVDFNKSAQFSFFEANWVALFQVQSGNTNAASIVVGNPTTDPSAGMIKVFVTQSYPQIINQSVLFNTIRFVKITEDVVPTGNYVWPATITNSDGSTVTVTLTVTVY